ncbi:MAG: transglycosylase domain-containing protein [Bacteroides sp.]
MAGGKRHYSPVFGRIFWGIFLGGVLFIVILFVMIAQGFFGVMPTFEELENPNSNLASEVLADDQTTLGAFYIQNRSFVGRQELSQGLVDALIATEDIRFYEHSGIDARGLGRVLFKTVMLGKGEAGGGSTITQQLAKNLFPRDSTYSNSKIANILRLGISKFKEWITAIKLERNYTKDEILTMYLNTVPFGSNAYGIKMAARTFFNTTPDSLKLEEAAVLVGLVKGPSWYSPVRNPERSKERRNTVLQQMLRYHKISQREYDSLSELPLTLHFQVQDHNSGIATYLREHLRQIMTAPFPQPQMYYQHEQYQHDSIEWIHNPLYGWCQKNKKPDGSVYNLYRDGLRIYTTINANLQRYAEESVIEHIGTTLQPAFDAEKKRNLFSWDVKTRVRELTLRSGLHQSERYRNLKRAGVSEKDIEENFDTPTEMTLFTWKHGARDTVMTPRDSILYVKRQLRVGFMAQEPGTGRVRAYVGGTNFKFYKYDQVYTARRQIGSTIKPFLYTLAMQEGYSPCMKVPNVPQVFEVADTIWSPKNSNPTKKDGEMVTLKWGLANSVNNISAWLIKQFSPEAMAELLRRFGIRSHIDEVPSIFLGTSIISVYELVASYGVFASGGVYTEPYLVSRIEDKSGNILATFTPQRREVISQETAYRMLSLLRSVVDQGSGKRLRYMYRLEGPLGGKTGTTQNNADGWFMCVHPNIVMGTWVGAEDPAVHFSSMALGQGAAMALPIQGLFLQKAYADSTTGIRPDVKWAVPESLQGVSFDCDETHEDPTEGDEYF